MDGAVQSIQVYVEKRAVKIKIKYQLYLYTVKSFIVTRRDEMAHAHCMVIYLFIYLFIQQVIYGTFFSKITLI